MRFSPSFALLCSSMDVSGIIMVVIFHQYQKHVEHGGKQNLKRPRERCGSTVVLNSRIWVGVSRRSGSVDFESRGQIVRGALDTISGQGANFLKSKE